MVVGFKQVFLCKNKHQIVAPTVIVSDAMEAHFLLGELTFLIFAIFFLIEK